MMNVRKFVLLLVVVCIAGYYAQGHFVEKKVLRIGMECEYPPNNWEESKPSESNLPIANRKDLYAEGYDVQIAKRVAERLGRKPEIVKVSWGGLFEALNSREIDVIFSGMLDTPERRQHAAFSDSYEVTKTEYTVLVEGKGKYAKAKSLAELAGARVIGQKDTLHDDVVNQIPQVRHLVPADTVSEGVNHLVEGEADAVIVDVEAAAIYEKRHNDLLAIRFNEGKGFKLNYSGVCAGVRKRDTNLLNQINKAIDGISARDRRRIMDTVISRLWRMEQ